MRILIVEDEYLLAHSWADALSAAGHHIAGTAASAPQALRLIEAERPDAAILDANIRGGNAEQVAAELSRHGIRFLVVSGHTGEDLRGDLRGKPFLRKPIPMGSLVRALETLAAGISS